MLNIVAELDYDYFSSSTILLVSSRPNALRVVTRTLPNAPVPNETSSTDALDYQIQNDLLD
jgi:hypothetical protein